MTILEMKRQIEETGTRTGTFTLEILRTATRIQSCGTLLIGKRYCPCVFLYQTYVTSPRGQRTEPPIFQELIKVRGFQVAPTEIEGVLFNHPNIVDAAVIGIQHSIEESELPRAYVVARPGSILTVQGVREYVAERLARYKNLDGGIKFVDSIPKNLSGKVLKHVLRELAKKETDAKL